MADNKDVTAADIMKYPQVIVLLDDANPNALEELKQSMANNRFEIDFDKVKGGILVNEQVLAFPGIYNPVTHFFDLPSKSELRDFARVVAEASKGWPNHCFFMAVNGAGDGQNHEPSNQCLLMIMEEDDIDTVEGGCPPNGLYVVLKNGEVIVSSDKLYGGSPDEVAYFSKWLFRTS